MVMADLEGGIEDGTEDKEARMGRIGGGKGLMGEMNIVD